jgi:hypothetical protein
MQVCNSLGRCAINLGLRLQTINNECFDRGIEGQIEFAASKQTKIV